MKENLHEFAVIPLFSGFDEKELAGILHCLSGRVREYAKDGQVLIEGDAAIEMGAVLSGRVQVVLDDYFGNRELIAELEGGELFGEAFALAGARRNPVSVTARGDCRVLFLNCRKLLSPCGNACPAHQRLIFNLLKITAEKNIVLNRKIGILAKRSTREKILAYLSFEAKKAGASEFSIPFDRQELADYLSVNRSALSAELGSLRRAGILSCSKNRFRLHRVD